MRILLRWTNLFLVLGLLVVYVAPFVPPQAFWPLVFPGLFFPWLLVANVLFLIFWLLRKQWKIALLPAGALLLGFGHVRSLVGWPAQGSAEASADQLTVVTYNIHRLYPYYGDSDNVSADQLAGHLVRYQPDLICLQEMPSSDRSQRAIARAFAKKLDLPYAEIKGSKSLAIFSRYPLSETGEEYFQSNATGFQWAQVEGPGGPFWVYNVHLLSNKITGLAEKVSGQGHLNEKETWLDIRTMLAGYKNTALRRVDQGARISEHRAKRDGPILMCGDFNDIPQSYTYRTLRGDLHDAFQRAGRGIGVTYAGRLPGLRIDYILSSSDLRPRRCFRGPHAFSDHHPVIAHIDRKAN